MSNKNSSKSNTKTIKFEDLANYAPLFEQGDNRNRVKLEDIYGTSLVEDSGIVETQIFVTEFASKDVQDFQQILQMLPVSQHRFDLETNLTRLLLDWRRRHQDRCPLEPFLWALKSTDNYVGSAYDGAPPQKWLLEAVGNAVYASWREGDETYMAVLKNVLLHWEWYQPVHVMLYVYGKLDAVQDEELDTCVRRHWLNDALFYTTAFRTLCRKKKTADNIKTLMTFLSRDTRADAASVTMQITGLMRTDFCEEYLRATSLDEYEIAWQFYTANDRAFSKKACKIFDDFFAGGGDPGDEVRELVTGWRNADSEEAKSALRRELSRQFDKKDFQKEVIHVTATENVTDLAQEIVRMAAQKTFEFDGQFIVLSMLDCVDTCEPYREFLTNGYASYGRPISDDRSFLFSSAWCLMNHIELLPELTQSFYMRGTGANNEQYIFFRVAQVYRTQYNEVLDRLTGQCMADPDMAADLIRHCAKIFRSNNAKFFPRSFEKVCDSLITAVEQRGRNYVTYADILMDLYEKIVNVHNRNRFHDVLMRLYYLPQNRALRDVRRRAEELIHAVYGGMAGAEEEYDDDDADFDNA